MPDHFCHTDLHSNTSESSAGSCQSHTAALWVWVMHRHAGERIPPLTSLSPQEECSVHSGCTHCAVSRNNLLKLPLWSWGEGDAEEGLMVLRELDKERSMEIISISVLLFPENGASLVLTSLKCPFKKGGAFSTAHMLYDLGNHFVLSVSAVTLWKPKMNFLCLPPMSGSLSLHCVQELSCDSFTIPGNQNSQNPPQQDSVGNVYKPIYCLPYALYFPVCGCLSLLCCCRFHCCFGLVLLPWWC